LKKILIISYEFPPHPGGIGSYGYSLTEALKSKFDVHVLALEHNLQSKSFDDSLDYPVNRIPIFSNRIKAIINRFIITNKIINRLNPDIIILNNNTSLISIIKHVLFKNKRIIVVGHGLEFFMLNTLKGKVYGYLLKKVDKIIPNSDFTRSKLNENLNIEEKKVDIIFPCADEDDFYPVDLPQDEFFRILTLGRVGQRKNHELTIEAISQLPSEVKEQIRYDIIGKGPKIDEFKLMTKKLDLENNVIFHGFLDRDTIRNYLNKADLFTMPSHNSKKITLGDIEGFGIVLVEANFCKTPGVGSFGNGTESVIKEGINGFLINEFDVKALKDIIIDLFSDRAKLEKLKESSYDYSMKNFTKFKFKRRWEKQIFSIIGDENE
jgi:phosphatidylinositol alpha-1,6-mannosyltransferase